MPPLSSPFPCLHSRAYAPYTGIRCESIDDFLWQQQLRYYWERSGADDDCIIRHADSVVNYG